MRAEALAVLTRGLPPPPGGWRDGLTLDQAGLDSVALVDRLFEIEERFDLQLPGQLGDTLGELLDAIGAARRR